MITKNSIFILLFILLGLESLTGQVKINDYDLDYKFDFKNNRLSGVAKITIDGKDDTINLLLYRLLKVTSITDPLGNSINFEQNVVSFEDFEELQVNAIDIYFDNIEQKNTQLIVKYAGPVLGYSETGMSYVKDHISPEFTIIRMDAFTYPVQSSPSIKDLRMSGMQYFNFKISVTVPDSLKVACLGKLIKTESRKDKKKYSFESVKPSWRMDIVIGKYKTLEKENYKVYYFPEDSIGAQNVLSAIEKTSRLYSRWFGEKDLKNFSIIEIKDGYGSQTDECGIIQTASAFKKPEYLEGIYHEVSHLWNIPHTDQLPSRLESEGLAMFLQFLVKEKLENKNNYLDEMAQLIYLKVKKEINQNAKFAVTPIIKYGEENLTDYSYSKGMLFFYILYHTVGEEAFFESIKGYYKTFASIGSTTTEFSEYLKNHFIDSSVNMLIDDWIFTNISTSYLLNSKNVQDLKY